MNGEQLRRWREGQGATQEQAAAWWGCSLRTWQRYEHREMIPRPLLKRVLEDPSGLEVEKAIQRHTRLTQPNA